MSITNIQDVKDERETRYGPVGHIARSKRASELPVLRFRCEICRRHRHQSMAKAMKDPVGQPALSDGEGPVAGRWGNALGLETQRVDLGSGGFGNAGRSMHWSGMTKFPEEGKLSHVGLCFVVCRGRIA
jgi:hypothetical protein